MQDCFFFQAEDGIRDIGVTGVQTCALPISASVAPNVPTNTISIAGTLKKAAGEVPSIIDPTRRPRNAAPMPMAVEIGRAAGRGRVEISGGAVSLKKKKDHGDDSRDAEVRVK